MAIKEGQAYLSIVVPQDVKDAINKQATVENSSASRIAARILMNSEEVKKYVETTNKDARS